MSGLFSNIQPNSHVLLPGVLLNFQTSWLFLEEFKAFVLKLGYTLESSKEALNIPMTRLHLQRYKLIWGEPRHWYRLKSFPGDSSLKLG